MEVQCRGAQVLLQDELILNCFYLFQLGKPWERFFFIFGLKSYPKNHSRADTVERDKGWAAALVWIGSAMISITPPQIPSRAAPSAISRNVISSDLRVRAIVHAARAVRNDRLGY